MGEMMEQQSNNQELRLTELLILAFLWMIFAVILFITVFGIALSYIITVGAGLWISYRIIRGWLALNEGRPMPIRQ